MSAPSPGGRNQTAVRNFLRIAGVLLGVVGAVLVIVGFVSFVTFDGGFDEEPTTPFLMFGGGALMAVIGFGMASAGYQGAVARFTAGEQAPVWKDTAHYLSDGEGVLGVGRTRSEGAAPQPRGGSAATGPFCRSCGTRNDSDARFCDNCGAGMA